MHTFSDLVFLFLLSLLSFKFSTPKTPHLAVQELVALMLELPSKVVTERVTSAMLEDASLMRLAKVSFQKQK